MGSDISTGVTCPHCGYVHHWGAELIHKPSALGWTCYRCDKPFAAEIELKLAVVAAGKKDARRRGEA